ncbi:MAG TPA: ABC transporter permease, partial [Gemmatimonadaceae bacterium]|nr:ABC transporter permease [Gemmatimonadaceae bacterium]
MADNPLSRDPILPARSRARINADLDAEFTAWIDARAAELARSGVAPEEARARAISEFGNVERARAYCADQDVASQQRIRFRDRVAEFTGDLRIAARMLRRAPLVTGVVLLTFGIGIGAMTAVFSTVYAVLLKPLPFRDPAGVAILHETVNGKTGIGGQISAAALIALRERAPTLASVAGMTGGGGTILSGGEPFPVPGARITANAFDVLGVRAALGATFSAGDDSAGAAPVIVLSDGLWRRQFGGDSGIIGKALDLNGVQRRVIGVMPRGFRLPTYEDADVWTPLSLAPVMRDVNRVQKFRFLRALARLAPGATPVSAQADIDRTFAQLKSEHPDAYESLGAKWTPVRVEMTGELSERLWLLAGAAGMLLLIACANIAGVLLTRAAARTHELSIRTALGAGRFRIARQFAAEGIMLAAAGTIVGVAFAGAGIAIIRRIARTALPPGTTISLEPRVMLFALAAGVAGGVLFTLVPALAASRTPARSLSGAGSRGAAPALRARLRTSLIAAQLTVTVVLLVGAGLLSKSLRNLLARDLGYETAQSAAFFVVLPATRYPNNGAEDQFWSSLYARVAALPGVEAVGGAGYVPLGGSSSSSLAIERKPADAAKLPEVRYVPVSDDYFRAMGIPLLKGRTFTSADNATAPGVVVISASAARKYWEGEDPVGARIRLGPDPSQPWETIIGVAADVSPGVDGEPQPTAYVSQRQDHWGSGTVVVRTTSAAAGFENALRSALKQVDPLLPMMQFTTMADWRWGALSGRRLPMQLMLVFAIAALFLSAVGVYGVCAYLVESRKREFGIRMALGAPQSSVLRLALSASLVAAGIGIVVGTPLAWLGARQVR